MAVDLLVLLLQWVMNYWIGWLWIGNMNVFNGIFPMSSDVIIVSKISLRFS